MQFACFFSSILFVCLWSHVASDFFRQFLLVAYSWASLDYFVFIIERHSNVLCVCVWDENRIHSFWFETTIKTRIELDMLTDILCTAQQFELSQIFADGKTLLTGFQLMTQLRELSFNCNRMSSFNNVLNLNLYQSNEFKWISNKMLRNVDNEHKLSDNTISIKTNSFENYPMPFDSIR